MRLFLKGKYYKYVEVSKDSSPGRKRFANSYKKDNIFGLFEEHTKQV